MRLQFGFRAVVSFALGVAITFLQSHSGFVGLVTLGIFGVLLGLGGSVIALFKRNGLNPLQELPIAALALIVGLFAFLASHDVPGQRAAFLALVAAWGLISGAFELYQARRLGFKTTHGRDLLINACVALLLGVLFLAVPLDIVSAVGFFGAYLALSGVHLGIAASSGK